MGTSNQKAQIKKENKEIKKENTIIKATEFIKAREWKMHLYAYPDHKQWSICWGIKSYPGEKVTEKECIKRLEERVIKEVKRVEHNNLTSNQEVALASFFYNIGYKRTIHLYAIKWDDKSVIYLMNKYIYASWKVSKGLIKRRAEEIKLYTK